MLQFSGGHFAGVHEERPGRRHATLVLLTWRRSSRYAWLHMSEVGFLARFTVKPLHVNGHDLVLVQQCDLLTQKLTNFPYQRLRPGKCHLQLVVTAHGQLGLNFGQHCGVVHLQLVQNCVLPLVFDPHQLQFCGLAQLDLFHLHLRLSELLFEP